MTQNRLYTNELENNPQLDNNIINGILNTDLGNTKVCLMYDSLARFLASKKGPPPYDFNDPEIYNTFVDEIKHIADIYFSNPNYFTINGRPVLLTRLLSRSIENLFYYNFLIFFDKITH
jgi:hypothetical protein